MSKNNNVNPNFYKDAGREHTDGSDKAKPHDEAKQQFAQAKKDESQGKEGQPNFIPGGAPVGEPGRNSGNKE